MTRLTRTLLILAIGILLVPFATRLDAERDKSNGAFMRHYGDVTLSGLSSRVAPGAYKSLPHRRPHSRRQGEEEVDKDGTLLAGPTVSGSTSTPQVVVGDAGFDGVQFAEVGAVPPDTQVAVGPNHVFEATNGRVRIWNRASPPVMVKDVDLGEFFGVGFLTTLTDVVSDPRVIYDPASNRWFVSIVTLESLFSQGDWRLAVSTTADPTGTYKLYASTFNGRFPDFPSLGLNADKLALTGNSFDFSEQFIGSEFLVINKADLLAGSSAPRTTYFAPPQAVDTIQVATSLSSTSTLYLAAIPGDGATSTLQTWSITGVPGVGAGVTKTTQSLTMAAPVVIPPDAAQPGSSVEIITNDARLLNLVYRDGFLWGASTTGCTPAGDSAPRACLHYVQVQVTGATHVLAQEITFGQPSTYYYYPGVTVDGGGNMVTVFNRSSGAEFASVYVSGHSINDAAGTLQTPLLIHSGAGTYDTDAYGVPPRWGDYSGIAVDPFDGGASVWVAGEYMRAEGGANWGTWVARIAAGSGCVLPAKPTGLTATPGNAQVALSWSTSSGAAAYNVKRALVNGGPYTTIASAVSGTAYTNTGLTNGTTYYYVVSALNSCGESADSTQASATPVAPQTAPLPPTNLKATGVKGKVNLSWVASTSGGVTQNRVYRSSTSGGPYTQIGSTNGTAFVDTTAPARATSYYVVRAYNGTTNLESTNSNQASARPK